jgi:RNA polymerase sigma-70 factor (ECF subfamily)
MAAFGQFAPSDAVASPCPAAPALTTAQIFREHGARVWRLLQRLGVPDADLDDLTQEVFIAVHRGLHRYEERNQLKAWLYRICVRESSRHHRRSGTLRTTVGLEDLDPTSPDASPEAAAAASEALVDLDRLLSVLDEVRRTIFVLYELEELSMAEVAAAVACPLQTAYSRLHSARKLILMAAKRLEAKRSLL